MITGQISGQWTGQNLGTNDGGMRIELDRFGDRAKGFGYLFEKDPAMASTLVALDFDNSTTPQRQTVEAQSFDPKDGWVFEDKENQKDKEALFNRFPTSIPANRVDISIDFPSKTKMKVTWKTDVDTNGGALLTKSVLPDTSQIGTEDGPISWDTFKEIALGTELDGFIFRGQEGPWPLQTSFHRTGRSDLNRYIVEDTTLLWKQLSGHLGLKYNRFDPVHNSTLMALAQHHGFPTPTLDWSRSPFVAAYFAVRKLLPENAKKPKNTVRVFALNLDRLTATIRPSQAFTRTYTYLMAMQALPVDNPRLVPQQGILTSTNIHDIEEFLLLVEAKHGVKLIHGYDIKMPDPKTVIRELRLMGIVASALFPGIDGICEDLRSERFLESR